MRREVPRGCRGCPRPQQHTDPRDKGQQTTSEADHHQRLRKQSGSPHQVAQKSPIPEPGAELRAEKGGLVMYGEQSMHDVSESPAVVCGVGEILRPTIDRSPVWCSWTPPHLNQAQPPHQHRLLQRPPPRCRPGASRRSPRSPTPAQPDLLRHTSATLPRRGPRQLFNRQAPRQLDRGSSRGLSVSPPGVIPDQLQRKAAHGPHRRHRERRETAIGPGTDGHTFHQQTAPFRS